jgi:hypothetical protein
VGVDSRMIVVAESCDSEVDSGCWSSRAITWQTRRPCFLLLCQEDPRDGASWQAPLLADVVPTSLQQPPLPLLPLAQNQRHRCLFCNVNGRHCFTAREPCLLQHSSLCLAKVVAYPQDLHSVKTSTKMHNTPALTMAL